MTASEREAAILSLKGRVEKTADAMLRRLPNEVQRDDLINCGWIGAIHAVDHFEPDRGFPLDTFAARRIKGEMLDYLRRIDPIGRKWRSKIRSREAPEIIVFRIDCPGKFVLQIPDSAPLGQVRIALTAIDCTSVIRHVALTKMERRYLRFYFCGLTDYEIARRIRKSPGRPCQLFQSIVKRARASLRPAP